MGTRHLVAVVYGGEYKIAQYGQWDGYPDGQGLTVLNFLRNSELLQSLKNSLSKVRFFDPDGRDKAFLDSYTENAPEWSSDQDKRTPEQKKWFSRYISRDIGGDILENIALSDDNEILLENSIEFANDSLFCEWGYVVDLDDGVLECYEGFQKNPVTDGRFASLEPRRPGDEYYPIKIVKSYRLDCLPDDEQFVSDLSNEGND